MGDADVCRYFFFNCSLFVLFGCPFFYLSLRGIFLIVPLQPN